MTVGPGKLVVVAGPTASGKSALAVALALRYRGEIISADSMQVYRGLDLGTAKPGPRERELVPHHLIDVVNLDAQFSVAAYQKMAWDAITGVQQRGCLPFLVGGTLLYVRAVVDAYALPSCPPDPGLRAELWQQAQDLGREWLHARLAAVDPVTAGRIHPNDAKRVIRALEVYHTTGLPRSAQEGVTARPPFDAVFLGLNLPRPQLYRAIDKRVDTMVDAGLAKEVAGLIAAGYGPHLYRLGALGYRELADYHYGLSTLAEAVTLIKRNTRRYAKRQLTWLRAERRIKLVEVGENRAPEDIVADASKVLQENGVEA
ncbi:MAG: tRNA (adenosine(37)-N6)-dimethylallyltransferase MiaA [Bacillota bacterium]